MPQDQKTLETIMRNASNLKGKVKEFWNEKSFDEIYATGQSEQEYYGSESNSIYALEPYIHDFAKFYDGKNKDVLEIGVGVRTDHAEWAKSNPKITNGS